MHLVCLIQLYSGYVKCSSEHNDVAECAPRNLVVSAIDNDPLGV